MIILFFLIDFILINFVGLKSALMLINLHENNIFYILLTAVFLGFLWNNYLLALAFIILLYLFNKLLSRLKFKNKTLVISVINYMVFLLIVIIKNGFEVMLAYLYSLPFFILLCHYIHKLKKKLI